MNCPQCDASTQSELTVCTQCGFPLENLSCGPKFEYVGFWRRLLAFVLDYLLLDLALSLIEVVLQLTGIFVFSSQVLFGSQFVLRLLANWLYFSVLESSPWQASVGKRILGIVVTDLNGKKLSWGRAATRELCKFLSSFPLGAGFLKIGFSPEKRALHDSLAGTIVISRSSALARDKASSEASC